MGSGNCSLIHTGSEENSEKQLKVLSFVYNSFVKWKNLKSSFAHPDAF